MNYGINNWNHFLRNLHSNCPPGTLCQNNSCVQGCHVDQDTCPPLNHCNGTDCIPGCGNSDSSCPPGTICEGGQCVNGEAQVFLTYYSYQSDIFC